MFSFPIIREMQKPQWDTISYPWRWIEIFNWIISSVGKDLGQWNVISTTTLENNLALSSKLKDIHSPRPSNSTSRYTAEDLRLIIANIQKNCSDGSLYPDPRTANVLSHLLYCHISVCIKRYYFLNHLRINCRHHAPYPQIFQHRFT